MQALVCKGYNSKDPISTLSFENVSIPQVKGSQVLVKMNYASINPADHMYMQGIYKSAPYKPEPKFPCALGTDGAGFVAKIGEKVTKFAPQQAVFGLHADVTHGTFAQYAVFEEAELATFDSQILSFKEAASIPLVFTTAFKMFTFVPASQLQALDTVVINGASGGIGSWCVLLSKYYYKAKQVIGICSAKNASYVQSLGADQLLDYGNSQDMSKLKLLKNVTLVLQCVGVNEEALLSACDSKSTFVTIVPKGLEDANAGFGAVVQFIANVGWHKIQSAFGNHPGYHFCGATPDGSVLEKLVKWLQSDAAALQAFRLLKINEVAFTELKSGIEQVMSKRTVGKLVVPLP